MLDLKTIYALSSYKEKDGTPRSASAVIITKLPPSGEGDPVPVNTAYLIAPLVIKGEGGCTVITVLFPKDKRVDFLRVAKICMEWLNQDTDTALVLQVVPFCFRGMLSILFQHLAFCDFYETTENYKLILAFDGTKTILLGDDSIDMETIMKEAERETENELRQMDEAISAEEAETAAIEKQINESLMPDLTDINTIIDFPEDDMQKDQNTRYSD